jgi:PAS domain S-box-containing protein
LERRLKLIIETAPAGLMLIEPSGRMLAANKAALAQLSADRLDDVVGKNFTDLVPGDPEAVAAFMEQVASGAPGCFAYAIARGSERRTIEVLGSPIRRGDEGDSTAVLAAAWDVTDRARSAGEMESPEAIVASERNTLDDAPAQAQPAAQWIAERDALTAQLSDADRQITLLARERAIERERGLAALEEAERASQLALAQAEEERARLEAELATVRDRHDAALTGGRAEQDRLAQTIRELTMSHADLVSRHAAERADAEFALQAERLRCSQLLDEQRVWRTALAEAVRGTNDSTRRLKRLLDAGPHPPAASSGERGNEAADGEAAEPAPQSTAADSHQESSCPL